MSVAPSVHHFWRLTASVNLVSSDEHRHRAFVAVREIASAVAQSAVSVRDIRGDAAARRRRPPNAFAGLFHAYADMAEIVPDGMETCAKIVDHCLDRGIHAQNLSLFGGWAGLGWTTTHLDADDRVGVHVDRLLTDALGNWPPSRGYDLISGLVGVGGFFLERLPAESAAHGLVLVLDVLERESVEVDDGRSWFTAPEFLPAWQREHAPNGYFNLGVAHGVPGVCWLLAKLCLAGIEQDRVEPLLRASLRWVRSTQPDPGRAGLPSWIAPGVDRAPSRRMAWCYGPLGASAVTLEAARAVGDRSSMEWARALALACARVPPAEARIRDAGLCHGAAGNAQIFQRLYRNTADEDFRVAALRWIDEALRYRRPGEGIGGYRMWGEVGENHQGWLDDASFLTGSGGVGLALLSAVAEVEPKWDRLLLLS